MYNLIPTIDELLENKLVHIPDEKHAKSNLTFWTNIIDDGYGITKKKDIIHSIDGKAYIRLSKSHDMFRNFKILNDNIDNFKICFENVKLPIYEIKNSIILANEVIPYYIDMKNFIFYNIGIEIATNEILDIEYECITYRNHD